MNNTDYYFELLVYCRVTNVNTSTTYLNSVIGASTIGNTGNSSLINVPDSANNGNEGVTDPDNNGNAGEPGENIPTPFNFGTLTVRFINVAATLNNKTSASINGWWPLQQ